MKRPSITSLSLSAAGRRLSAIGLGLLIAMVVAGGVSAKGTPYFSVEVSPTQPVAGEAVVVTIRTWEDVAHTVPARLHSAALLEGLIVLRPDSRESPDVAVPLKEEAPDVFRSIVVVPAAGDWKLVTFPDRSGWGSPDVPAGYPDSIALTVQAPNAEAPVDGQVAGIAALVVIIGTAAILAVRARRLRSTSVVRSSSAG